MVLSTIEHAPYPDPKLHTLRGMVKGKPLEKITTCDLTRAIRGASAKVTPRSKEACGERIVRGSGWSYLGPT